MRALGAALTLGLLLGCTAGRQPDGREDLSLEVDPVVLGAILPLSGPLAPFGAAQRRGIERALDRANAAGGVDVGGEQRPVRLEVADDRGSADAAGQFAWSFVLGRSQVTALLGACAPHRTVLSVAEARDVPLVSACGPLASTGAPTSPAWSWETGPPQLDRAAAVVNALADSGGRRLAVFLSPGRDGSTWGRAAADAGLALAGTWTAPQRARPERTGVDWSQPVAQARAAGADLVVADTDPPDGVPLWRALDAGGLSPRRAWAREAGLGSAWRAQLGPAGDGTLAEAHGDLSAGADEAVADAAAGVTDLVLNALTRAGSDRRVSVNDALDDAGARPAGTAGDGPPPRLAVWRAGALVPLGRG